MHKCLKISRKTVKREAYLVISNISTGTLKKVGAIINEEGLIKTLERLLENDCEVVKQ